MLSSQDPCCSSQCTVFQTTTTLPETIKDPVDTVITPEVTIAMFAKKHSASWQLRVALESPSIKTASELSSPLTSSDHSFVTNWQS